MWNSFCSIETLLLTEIGNVILENGLYTMNSPIPQPSSSSHYFHIKFSKRTRSVAIDEDTRLTIYWKLLAIKSLLFVLQILILTTIKIFLLAKIKRLSFPHQNHIWKNPFDLVHWDIWGPFNQTSYDNKSYFLTIVDECSQFTWIYLIRQKSEATLRLK